MESKTFQGVVKPWKRSLDMGTWVSNPTAEDTFYSVDSPKATGGCTDRPIDSRSSSQNLQDRLNNELPILSPVVSTANNDTRGISLFASLSFKLPGEGFASVPEHQLQDGQYEVVEESCPQLDKTLEAKDNERRTLMKHGHSLDRVLGKPLAVQTSLDVIASSHRTGSSMLHSNSSPFAASPQDLTVDKETHSYSASQHGTFQLPLSP